MPPAPPPPPAATPRVDEAASPPSRIAQLFRVARRNGSIHPLQHLIERYRAEQRESGAPR